MIKPKKNLRDKPVYGTELFFDEGILKLDANENLCGASPRVLATFRKAASTKVNFYPCYGEFLAELSRNHGLNVEFFLPTNGADEAINMIFNTYLEKGDSVVSFAPTFIMPKIYAEICECDFLTVDYDKKWEFDADKLIGRVGEAKNAKIIHLTSPNSPTGEVISRACVEKILKSYPDKAVLLDNVYINFSENQPDYISLVKQYDNLFIVKSFSKDFALAGLRLGYIITNPENVDQMKKVISPYSVNNVALAAGIAALTDKKHFERTKKEILKNKAKLIIALEKIGFKPYKSETNFILCDFGVKADFIYTKLAAHKISVKRFSGGGLENHFRITVPNTSGLKKLLAALKARDLLVFDLDGVVFDVRNSYRKAIEKTFEHFAKRPLGAQEIQDAKNLGGLNCDWDLTKYLLEKNGVEAKMPDVIEIFQGHFFKKQGNSMGLIDEEKLLLVEATLKKLVQKYDMCIFTGRPKAEALYSLEKYDILKYFNLVIGKEDLPDDKQKPCPDGLNLIKERSVYNKIYYFGDTSDDMKCAEGANAIPIGVLPPQDKSAVLTASLKAQGAVKVLKDVNKIKDSL